jgi:thiazole synthase
MMEDLLELGGQRLKSRLFTGTGKYASASIIPEVCKASESQVITMALRRVDFTSTQENLMDHIPREMILLPNTSGARTAEEAVRLAELARAAGCGNWVKIEVISDSAYLLPDGYETAKATEILSSRGFVVLPYINADLYVARSCRDAGAAAVMPLGSPIGSNRGIRCEEMIGILIDQIDLPVVVDAGIGKPSEAARAMEMGAAACLVNTAIASAANPPAMGEAFKWAVQAGRQAYLSGLGPVLEKASASSPLTGFLHD